MRIVQLTIICLLLTSAILAQSKPKGWRGIVPLHSTRADVLRLWGPPNVDGRLYEIDNKTVHIAFSDGPCEQGSSGWNVPRDTVVSVSLAPNKDLKFLDLHIDEKKYQKSKDGELPGIFYYTNHADGITISVSQGEVRNIYYSPASTDDHLRCPGSSAGYSNSQRRRTGGGGLVPLHSTRSDVERTLGKPNTDSRDYASYKMRKEKVSIIYATGPCEGLSGGWRVPRETVLEISVSYLDPKPKFADLKLDESALQRQPEGDKEDLVTYRDDKRGVVYVVNTFENLLDSVRYVPSANDDHIRCPSPPKNPDAGIGDSLRFDEYSAISRAEEYRRLKNFAVQLLDFKPEATGYIFACRQKRGGAPETVTAMRAENYLVNKRGVPKEQIMTMSCDCPGGQRIELWIKPKDYRAPICHQGPAGTKWW